MIKTIKKNSDIILEAIKKERQLSITDAVKTTGLERGKVRIAIAFLLGANKIEEVPFGMAKVYFLK